MECENHICEYGVKVEIFLVSINFSAAKCLPLRGRVMVQISKNKRHQDRTAALEVWERLEEFMRART